MQGRVRRIFSRCVFHPGRSKVKCSRVQSVEFIVPPESLGTRLDQYLVAQLAASVVSRARIQDLIKSGHVTLNAAVTKPNARLKAGDQIFFSEPAPAAVDTLPQEIALDVLFEDDDLIVLNKPAGMVVHPAAGNWDGTLVNALLHHCTSLSGIGGEQRPGIVHRLDKETSGCIVAAKNDLAHQGLSGQFARREVTKIYLALAAGHFPQPRGIINEPIHRHPVDRKKMTVVAKGMPGRLARTDWRVICEIGKASLVECTLHTGRTHQIRVHLKHLNHPLLGDELYGKRAGYDRQMLHAWRLGFTHPRTRERLSFESPIPLDFVEAGVPKTLP
ncbi:MAG: Pseudouridine synthase [Chthoniobacteraceae bacterium]|nr:Pseudouridine synthase [Chthoniobacteraceae bacterium]